MKKVTAILLVMVMVFSFAACGNNNNTTSTASGTGSTDTAAKFDATKAITVISREEGSGTRDAFIELTGVQTKDADGNKTDNTTDEAVIIDGTQAVMSSVASNEYAIGYISLGSLNDTVKAAKVGGVAPSASSIKDGSYILARPFNIATKENLSEVAQDFVDYILSTDGQKVVEANGCVALDATEPYAGSKPSGKIVIVGSSSVSPVMEKLKEAYLTVNTNATIEIQTLDSSAGISAAASGTCDIGMASRALKDSEKATLTETKIAMDGIAVIVNNDNPTEDLTKDQIAKIFKGEAEAWDEIG
ncbi:MAG: substrate-binding domain-containing protein [Candidatus Howiella sp.]|jgi:phosphate transport system substrate-binding protein